MCLVAFQKIFRKIFSGVWKKRRKTQIRKHKPQPRKKKSSTTKMFPVRRPHDRRRDLAKIAILPSRDRTVNRDLGSRSRSRTGAGARDLESRSRSCVVIVDDFFSWVVALCFLICVFLLLFQTPENIFRKIF